MGGVGLVPAVGPRGRPRPIALDDSDGEEEALGRGRQRRRAGDGRRRRRARVTCTASCYSDDALRPGDALLGPVPVQRKAILIDNYSEWEGSRQTNVVTGYHGCNPGNVEGILSHGLIRPSSKRRRLSAAARDEAANGEPPAEGR